MNILDLPNETLYEIFDNIPTMGMLNFICNKETKALVNSYIHDKLYREIIQHDIKLSKINIIRLKFMNFIEKYLINECLKSIESDYIIKIKCDSHVKEDIIILMLVLMLPFKFKASTKKNISMDMDMALRTLAVKGNELDSLEERMHGFTWSMEYKLLSVGKYILYKLDPESYIEKNNNKILSITKKLDINKVSVEYKNIEDKVITHVIDADKVNIKFGNIKGAKNLQKNDIKEFNREMKKNSKKYIRCLGTSSVKVSINHLKYINMDYVDKIYILYVSHSKYIIKEIIKSTIGRGGYNKYIVNNYNNYAVIQSVIISTFHNVPTRLIGSTRNTVSMYFIRYGQLPPAYDCYILLSKSLPIPDRIMKYYNVKPSLLEFINI